MRRCIAATGTALLIVSLASPAAAQISDEQVNLCRNQDQQYSRDQQIQGCTAIIQSGTDESDTLAWAHYNRGTAHVARGETEDGIADWSESIRLDPNDADSYVNRGTAYHRLGKFDLAIADYGRAIELDDEPHADSYMNRGNSYRRAHKLSNALADFNQAIEIDHNYWQAYYYRGNTYSDLKQYPRAIADYDTAIRLNADYALAYYWRGMAEKKLNKTIQADRDIAKAKSLDLHVAD